MRFPSPPSTCRRVGFYLDKVTHSWHVPILYNPLDFTADEVGHTRVDAITSEIQQHTPAAELRERAIKLHERHKTQIRTAFFRAGKTPSLFLRRVSR